MPFDKRKVRRERESAKKKKMKIDEHNKKKKLKSVRMLNHTRNNMSNACTDGQEVKHPPVTTDLSRTEKVAGGKTSYELI